MTIHGIDVSNNQGVIDWPAVAGSGIQFAILKASEGVKFVDPYLGANLAGARSNGIAVAVYHFALSAWNAPLDEAHHFLDAIAGRVSWGEPVILDQEDDPYGRTLAADVGPWTQSWLETVRAAVVAPLLYTDRDIITHRGLSRAPFGDYGLYLSAPGVVDPPAPAPWPFIAIQQTNWHGRVPGVIGDCDLDEFAGTVDQFRAYGQPMPAPGKPALDLAARLKLVGYIAGGSGPADIAAWVGGFA